MAVIIAWAILMTQTFWHCESQKGWTQEAWPQCHGGDAVAIPQIIGECSHLLTASAQIE